MKRVWTILATAFGLGYSPFAPGTVGSLPGLVIVYFLNSTYPVSLQIGIGLLLTLLAIPICDGAEKVFLKKDDRRIVADEYLTFSLCMIGLPVTPLMLAIAFVVNRICDIIKPPPAHQLQEIRGGLGIVIDDVIACLYALAINHGIYYALIRLGFKVG